MSRHNVLMTGAYKLGQIKLSHVGPQFIAISRLASMHYCSLSTLACILAVCFMMWSSEHGPHGLRLQASCTWWSSCQVHCSHCCNWNVSPLVLLICRFLPSQLTQWFSWYNGVIKWMGRSFVQACWAMADLSVKPLTCLDINVLIPFKEFANSRIVQT